MNAKDGAQPVALFTSSGATCLSLAADPLALPSSPDLVMAVPSLSDSNQDLLNEFIELNYLREDELDRLIEDLFLSECCA